MKKKLALCLALLLVVAMVVTVIAACNKDNLTDEQLSELIRLVRLEHNQDATIQNSDYPVLGVITDPDDESVSANIKWTANSDKITFSDTMNANNYYTVIVPDRSTLTDDLTYTLTATLVDGSGNAYTNESGDKYTADFTRKVEAQRGQSLDPNKEYKFVSLETPVAGTYYYGLYQEAKSEWWYANGEINSSGYLPKTTLPTEAAEFTLEEATGGWRIKVHGQYLQVTTFTKSGGGIGYKLELVDAASKVWTWDTTNKVFVMDMSSNSTPSNYYVGAYGTFDTFSPSAISYITTAGNYASRLGTFVEENYDHEHVYEYTPGATGSFKHTKSCTHQGCDKQNISEFCNPDKNVCPSCKHEFTESEILTRLFDTSNTAPAGNYTLTGVVTEIVDPAESQTNYWRISVNMRVGNKIVEAYRINGTEDNIKSIKLGAKIEVNGTLTIYNGTREFNAGCTAKILTPDDYNIEVQVVDGQDQTSDKGSLSECNVTLANTVQGGTEVKFKVTTTEGYEVKEVRVNGAKIEAGQDDFYTFTIVDHTTIKVVIKSEGEAESPTVTLQSTETTTGNMTGGNDANTKFGLDADIFNISSEKTNNGNNHVGLGNDGTIRLYTNHTSTLTIAVVSGYVIESIQVNVKTTNGEYLTVEVGGQAVTGSDGNYTVNAQSVSLWNSNTATSGNRIDITSIVVTYHAV